MLYTTLRSPEDGPLVVFLHAGGVSSRMWDGVLAEAPGVRALLTDLPGHGESRDVKWTTLETVSQQVEDAIKAAVGDETVHLAALSLGSYVATHILANGRIKCASAMLSGMHAGNMPNKRMMKIVSTLMAPFTNRPFMARKTAMMMLGEDGDIDAYVADATRTRTGAIRRAVLDVIDFKLPANLSKSEAQILFCAGSKENSVIVNDLDHLANLVKDGAALSVPDGGHGWPGKMPALFAETLKEHIAATKS